MGVYCIVTSEYEHNHAKYLLVFRVGRNVSKTDRCKACHSEIKRRYIAFLDTGTSHDRPVSCNKR